MAQRRWGNSPLGGDDTLFPVPAATPTFSPISGTYPSAQTVTISCSTPSSAIYYTTDGSTPTFPVTGTTTLYSGPITVSVTETVKAIAIAASYLTSAVGSAAYTIGSGIVFDFFVSPNGDDNNVGSLASPWSITGFNTNQSTYGGKGKKIGIIGDVGGVQTPYTHGTIGGVQTTLYSLMNSGGTGGQTPVINVDGGTSSVPTYVASCDSSGTYKPRWAILDFSNAGSYSTNATGVAIGQSFNGGAALPPHPGNLTFDAITVRYFTYVGISLQFNGTSQGLNCTVKNCEVYNGLCPDTSNNPGAIRVSNTLSVQLTNNKVHDLSTGAGVIGFNAFMTYGNATDSSMGIVCKNNTTYNCASWLTKDGFSDFADCSYNYFDFGNFGTGNNNGTPITEGVVTGHSPGTGVTSNFHHNICLGRMEVKTQTGSNTITGTLNCYQNTFYGPGTGTPFDALRANNGTGSPKIQFQHNIVYAIGSPAYDIATNSGVMFVDTTFGIANATFNNNVYGSNANGCQFSRASGGQGLSFATWKATYSVDSTSVQVATSPFTGTPAAQNPSSFATNSSAIIGGVTCGAQDGSGSIGCNF